MPPVLAWLDPPTAIAIVAGVGYWVGTAPQRPSPSAEFRRRWRGRALAFFGGLALVIGVLRGPVESLSERLFFVHMAQHVVLMLVAAPLLVLGDPWPAALALLPARPRRGVGTWLRHGSRLRRLGSVLGLPIVAWTAFNLDLWLWHLPALYDLTLRDQTVHDLEHVTFLGLGMLFWSEVIDAPPFRSSLDHAAKLWYLLAAMISSWVLALVFAYAPHVLYPTYASVAHRPFGISALTDQQLAAGVMWVPASIPLLIPFGIELARWAERGSTGADEPERLVVPPSADGRREVRA